MKLLSRLFHAPRPRRATSTLRVWPQASTTSDRADVWDWPADSAFHIVPEFGQLSDGRARCTRLCVCDSAGRPSAEFRVGDEVRLFAEFEILDEIGTPVLISNLGDGTNRMLQRACATPRCQVAIERLDPGSVIEMRQRFTLCVPPGVAFIDLGLASFASLPVVGRQAQLLFEGELAASSTRHCFLRAADLPLVVRLPETASAADSQVRVASDGRQVASAPAGPRATADFPAFLHVTHWKAGSQWIYAILRRLFPTRIVPPISENYQIHYWPIEPGNVYPTVYATKEELDRSAVPAAARKLVVLRDPRDTLISYYFSLKFSHAVTLDQMAHDRALVQNLDIEDGLLVAIEYWMQGIADIQSSWLVSGEPFVRYEDLVRDDIGTLKAALIDRLRLPIAEKSLRAAIEACRFKRLSGGRRQGQEDSGSHYRKGVAGDWRNHFTPRITAAFKRKFGDLLIAGGYERDKSW